jgi:hypothetical protein
MSEAKRPRTGISTKRGKRRRYPEIEALDIRAKIDDFFMSSTVIVEGQTSRRVSCFEAILYQLSQQWEAGSRRATKLLTRYINFAASLGRAGGIEIRYLDEQGNRKQTDD